MKSFVQLLEEEGELFALSHSTPLGLDDPSTVWLVAEGTVDLYTIAIHSRGPVGLRRFHARLEHGALFFGMNVEGETTFLAAGSQDARVFCVPRARFLELARSELYGAQLIPRLERWIRTLPSALSFEVPPSGAALVFAGETTALAGGEYARGTEPVLWVRPSAELEIFGMEGVNIHAGEYFPLPKEGWVRALEGVEIEALSTYEYLETGAGLLALDHFHRAISCSAGVVRARENAAEESRMAARRSADVRVMSSTIHRLAAIADHHVATDPNDSLLSACHMIGEHLGIEMRRPPDRRHARNTQDRLDDITRASRVRTRRVALRDTWWRTDSGVMLGARGERPLVLLPTSPTSYECCDPVDGTRRTVDAALARTLEPFAFCFYRGFASRALQVRDVMKLALAGSRRDLFVVLLIGLFGGALELILPLATGVVFDLIIPSSDQSLLLHVTLAIIAVAIANLSLSFCRAIAVLRAETRMSSNVQAAVWDRLLSLPIPFFRRFSSGELAARANGIETIRSGLSNTVLASLLSAIFAFWNLGLLFYLDRRLALFATCLILFAGAVAASSGLAKLRAQRMLSEVQGRISGLLLQLIDGIAKLRVAGAETGAFAVWGREYAKERELKQRSGTVSAWIAAFDASFPVIATAVVFANVYIGSGERLRTGEFLALNVAFAVYLRSFLLMVSALIALLDIVPSIERALPILRALPEVDPKKDHPGTLNGDIEVNQVSFRYSSDQAMVLDRVSFRVRPNELVAIVGPSGSGKSTLLRLLLGFEKPSSGAIYYSGHDLANVDVREVRRQLGVVLQNGRVMAGTIRDNVAPARILKPEEIWRALDRAAFARDVHEMPMQLDTFVGASGEGLSGGQKQRLLIARAIAADPRIVLLDEATSALDNAAQKLVTESLHKLGVTRIVIAHRLSTIRGADRILVLERGRIVQEGTFDTLMAVEGPFRRLAERQVTSI